MAGSAMHQQQQQQQASITCPGCSSQLPAGSKFCPHDGATLGQGADADDAAKPSGGDKEAGMVCPRCHRGYPPGAKFCPHDKEKLVPYPIWRERKKGVRR